MKRGVGVWGWGGEVVEVGGAYLGVDRDRRSGEGVLVYVI